MSDLSFESAELALAQSMADRAAEIAMRQFRRAELVKNKSAADFDPTTAADIEIEQMMRDEIKARFPAHAIHGEEMGLTGAADQPRWIIDPIDGTRNYYAGSLFWGILIALVEGDAVRLGVIDHPTTGERFFAEGQSGFWRQGDQLAALKTHALGALDRAILAATTPQLFTPDERRAFDQISERAAITLYGGNCYFYGLLALGQIGLVIEAGLEPYDIAALIPVVEAAGGIISDWRGQKLALDGARAPKAQVIAAANCDLHQQALALLAPAAI